MEYLHPASGPIGRRDSPRPERRGEPRRPAANRVPDSASPVNHENRAKRQAPGPREWFEPVSNGELQGPRPSDAALFVYAGPGDRTFGSPSFLPENPRLCGTGSEPGGTLRFASHCKAPFQIGVSAAFGRTRLSALGRERTDWLTGWLPIGSDVEVGSQVPGKPVIRFLSTWLARLSSSMMTANPYIAVIVLVAQLLSGGLLGPRMLCAHRDGSKSIEWAATTCCGGGRAETAAPESECGGCEGGCHEERSGLVLTQPDCDCVDSPLADEPVVRPAPPQATSQDDLVATFVAVVAVLVIDLGPANPSGFTHRGALPECLAPPRAHLATIVLRL